MVNKEGSCACPGKSSVRRLKICGAVRFCAAGLFMSRIMLSASAGSGPPSCKHALERSAASLAHRLLPEQNCSLIPIQSRPLLLFIRRDVHSPSFCLQEATKTTATVALSTRLNIASRVGKLTLCGCSAHNMAADPASHTTCCTQVRCMSTRRLVIRQDAAKCGTLYMA
jgi:hypothetical protein